MGEQIEKFENAYKEKYKNYSEYLTFPYFNERNIFLFDKLKWGGNNTTPKKSPL